MTKQEFQKLTEDHVLLLDGATGSNLMKAGMPRGVCTESWVLEHKDVIQSLQKAYIEAGSHIIYAPTFGGNRINLTMHGLEDQIEQINHTLAGYSKEIAPEGVFVAGDITTTGKMMAPAGRSSKREIISGKIKILRISMLISVDISHRILRIFLTESFTHGLLLFSIEAVRGSISVPVKVIEVQAPGRFPK